MQEIWKDVIGYEGHYQVSNLGRIKSIARKIWNGKGYYDYQDTYLKFRFNHKGYLVTNLSLNSKKHYVLVHRLVAKAFIENPNNYPQVNHIDGIKTNNKIDNLEWCNNSINQLHAYKLGLNKRSESAGKKTVKIKKFDINGNLLAEYDSIAQASKSNNLNAGNIRSVCLGNRNHCGGFYWQRSDVK